MDFRFELVHDRVRVTGFVLALLVSASALHADRVSDSETIVIEGKCLGGMIDVDTEDGKACACPPGTSEISDICVSRDLADFLDDPGGGLCEVFNCGWIGGEPPDPPEMNICDAGNGFTCAEEFENCRSNYTTDVDVCTRNNEATARTNCERNVWPNRSRYRNWHEIDGYYCPYEDDDPNDYNTYRWRPVHLYCESVDDVQDICMDAWVRDRTAGGGGGISLPGGGGVSGSSGGTPAGPLGIESCIPPAEQSRQECLRDVEEILSCPADCDPAQAPQMILLPDEDDRDRDRHDGTSRDALIALERQNQEVILTRLGYLFLDRNHREGAVAIFRLLVNTFPDSANARHSLGEALEAADHLERAVGRFREALGLSPDFAVARDDLERLTSE